MAEAKANKSQTAKAIREDTKAAAEKTAAAAKKVEERTKKAVAKVRKPTVKAFVQYAGAEYSQSDIADKCIDQFRASHDDVIARKMELYIKPEDNAAYYVINNEFTGKVELN